MQQTLEMATIIKKYKLQFNLSKIRISATSCAFS